MKGRKEIAAAYGLAMTGSAMLTAKKTYTFKNGSISKFNEDSPNPLLFYFLHKDWKDDTEILNCTGK
jgi:hypothetical protein